MSIHRIRFLCCLAAGAMLLWASVSPAQVRIPTENTIEDLQFFAPVESNAMSDRPYLKEGLFFNHDYLVWSVQRPRVAVLGDPGTVRNVVDTDTLLTFQETSSLNTGMYRDLLHDGNRTEIGWMYDGCGWIVGYTSLHERTQRVAQTHAPIVFNDPGGLIAGTFQLIPNFNPLDPTGLLEAGGPPPRGFFHRDIDGDGIFGAFGRDLGNVQDPDGPIGILPPSFFPVAGGRVTFNSVDPRSFPAVVPIVITVTPVQNGIPDEFPLGNSPNPDLDDLVPGLADFVDIVFTNHTDVWSTEAMISRRLHRISFKGHWELFAGVRYTSFEEQFHIEAKGNILSQTTIDNEAWNRIVGPQIGARWFRDCCRWRFAIEGRFAPSVNFQSVRLHSTIADALIPGGLEFQNSGIDTMHEYVFSPVGELRLNWSYQLTRAIAVRAGYTATYIGSLARPSNMIQYQIPNPLLIREHYLDDSFMQGLNLGFEVNR